MNDSKIKKAVIREDLLAITGDFRKAIILNQFIYWSERVSDADKFIEKENEIAKSNGKEERELFYGWIYKTAEELSEEVMLGLSASQIRRYINDLVDLKYISKRTNPNYKWDRTLQYRVNLVNIAKSLKKKGYPLSDYKIEIPDDDLSNTHPCAINDEPEKNQSQFSERTIPENNTDTTTDINSKANSFFAKKVADRNKIINPPEINQDELIGRINKVVDRIGKEVLTEEQTENVKSCMIYFVEKYARVFNKKHPILGEPAINDVIANITDYAYVEHENFTTCFEPLVPEQEENAEYEEIIDMYFETEFKQDIDYSIMHFSQKNVLIKLMGKATRKTWFINE